MSRIFVSLIMGADKGVVEGAQTLELCHRYLPMETYGLIILCMLVCFSLLIQLSILKMYVPQRPCAYFRDLT